MNILVVDDDAIARLIIEQNLKVLPDLESVIFKAENGKVALDCISKEAIDVILLDLNMPIMNGFEVLNVLQERGFSTPVFIVTSSNLNDDKQRCEEFKFVKGYFQKPITQQNLQLLKELS